MDGSFPPSAGDRRASLAELEAQITELAGQLNAAQYRWLMLIAEFDRRKGWSDGQLHSCAHWLNFKCGLNLGAAREKVRVAHARPANSRKFYFYTKSYLEANCCGQLAAGNTTVGSNSNPRRNKSLADPCGRPKIYAAHRHYVPISGY
jgi:hypothetical protein